MKKAGERRRGRQGLHHPARGNSQRNPGVPFPTPEATQTRVNLAPGQVPIRAQQGNDAPSPEEEAGGGQGGSQSGGPHWGQRGQKAAEQRRSSVPRDLDGRELPEVRLTHVQHAAEGRSAPLEWRQLVPRGAADCQEAQGLGQGRAGHLQVQGGQVAKSSQPRKPCSSPPTLTPPPTAPQAQHLHVNAPVGALVQSLEGVGAVGRVEVGAGRDGVLPVGLGGASFAQ